LLLGWDGADWQIIQPLVDAGQMPHLERLLNEGVMGNLATLRPTLSPMLWTSIATGKRADRHGVCGFVEPRADGQGLRPVASTSLKARTLWSILTSEGLNSAVVNWYASHPAQGVGGTVVSNHFRYARGENFDQWPLPPNCVAPESLREVMGDLRAHPGDLAFEQLRFFIPEAQRVNQEEDKRLETLARHLAECATVHAAGTYLAEHTSWDLLAVYLDTIDRLGHEFMWYRTPKMEHVSRQDFDLYRQVVDRCYLYHDLMLGRYLQLVGPETTVVIISDHGFFSDNLRPAPLKRDGQPPPLMCHRPFGIFVARGPGLKQDELVFGASLLDVAPTVLTMLGLPVGKDMEGRVLTQMFSQPVAPEFIETYETEPTGEAPGEVPEEDPWAAQEALKQLVALGYIEAPPEDVAQTVALATMQKLTNLAEVYLDKGETGKAAALLEDLLKRQPENHPAKLSLAQCRLHLGDIEGCRGLVDEVFAAQPESPGAQQAYGFMEMAQQHWDKALKHFKKAEAQAPALPQLHRQMGTAYLRLGKLTAAAKAFRKSLTVAGDTPGAYDGLGMALYRQKRYAQAEECFLRSLGCLFHQPLVHYHLGVALAVQGKLEPAIQSLKRALEFRPDLKEAHKVLIKVYQTRGNQVLADFHKAQASKLKEQDSEPLE
jgi:predicted AlkP superfamily phosphohydrolase/phosphomutase/tetratricopeptide (TPR) repeat protein